MNEKVEAIRKEFPDFKSPQDLGISDEEYIALDKVRRGLCDGVYTHTNAYETLKKDKKGFNMEVACTQERGCGTVACIGGWMAFEMDRTSTRASRSQFVATNDQSWTPLRSLFFPNYIGAWDKITPKIAAKAIGNFMMGDTKTPWKGLKA